MNGSSPQNVNIDEAPVGNPQQNPDKKKLLLLITSAVVLAALTLGGVLLWQQSLQQAGLRPSSPTPQPGFVVGEEITVEGTVVENIAECIVDGSCVLKIDVDGKEYSVPYGYGLNFEGRECRQSDLADAYNVKANERVEIFGKVISETEISPCNSPNYYIRLLESNTSIDISDWQTYRSEEFGYSIKIPPEFKVEDEGRTLVRFRTYTPERKWVDLKFITGIHSTDYNPETVEAWTAFFRNLEPGEKLDTTTIKIQNVNLDGFIAPQYLADQEEFADVNPNYDYAYVTMLGTKDTNSNVLILSAETKKLDVERYKPLYDQILSTFRFVE